MSYHDSSRTPSSPPSQGTPSPADLQGLFSAAVGAHQSGKFAEAEQFYLQVLALRPENVNLLCNLGLLYRDMGQADQALARLQKARDLAPDNFAVNLNIGALFEEQAELEQAVAAYRAAQELAPQDPRVMNNLGKVLYQQGDRDGALDYLNRAVTMAPDYGLAQNNLGVLLTSLGQVEEAVTCFRNALATDDKNCDTLYNLAGALTLVGQEVEAERCYRKLLAIEPQHAAARHMLAALTGGPSDKAPAAYVVDTFDRYAGHFDQQLTETLGYKVPAVLREALLAAVGPGPYDHCLDLGCGTGLSGLAFRDLAHGLSGIDLSPRMLAQARAKRVYDQLHQEELVAFLDCCQERFDLFVATDVFIYIGDLVPVFEAIRARAAVGAYLAFSIETTAQRDHVLRASGRYAQSLAYIRRLTSRCAFREVHCQPCNIRKERGQWLAGHIFILQAR